MCQSESQNGGDDQNMIHDLKEHLSDHLLYPGINKDLRYPEHRSNVWSARRALSDGLSLPTYIICGNHEDDTPLPIREVFMLAAMEQLTDKPDWHKKVFDDEIVAKWKKEALEHPEADMIEFVKNAGDKDEDEESDCNCDDERCWCCSEQKTRDIKKLGHDCPYQRIMNEAAFDFCVAELRVKAGYFERTGLIPTLDSNGFTVAKSDTLVDEDLKKELRAAFDELRAEQFGSGKVDWHPNSNDMVLDLVHPSLYPFVYGRSPFIQEEVVGITDAVETWAGKGARAPADPTLASSENRPKTTFGDGDDWSACYQWLPANLAFQEDGSVRFTSYVNNLHPGKHANIYRILEKLISLSLPAWDQVLGEAGRKKSRFEIPDEADDNKTEGLWEPLNKEILAKTSREPTRQEMKDIETDYEWDKEKGLLKEGIDQLSDAIDKWKWEQIRCAILPDAADDPKDFGYDCSRSITEMFNKTGLQVIVKMARIELTPEKPSFPQGSWHVEGMINERICATALYYLDSENITETGLDFRKATDSDMDGLRYIVGQSAYSWIGINYGTDFSQDYGSAIQYYGRVGTPEGRLLAFPNVFQHRVAPFSLKDPTKPGHRSFVALWLVDPTLRIVSTANVPPQQLDWFTESTFSSGDGNGDAQGPNTTNLGNMPPELVQILLEKQGMKDKIPGDVAQRSADKIRLPPELMDMLRDSGDGVLGSLMSLEEAREHRLKLMDERSGWNAHVENNWNTNTYNFCEH